MWAVKTRCLQHKNRYSKCNIFPLVFDSFAKAAKAWMVFEPEYPAWL